MLKMQSYKKSNKLKFLLYKNNKKKPKSEDETIRDLEEACNNIDAENIKKLEDFPLSDKTKKGLNKHKFIDATEIQRASLGYSLRREDILGAAKTGSGKTLAFLIPMLEVLYRKKWTKYDQVGALVITPTRELAYQIFETLKKVGEFHDFSAGLIIGGKDLKFERKRMDQCNIVICTPGRLLHHMDENPLFDCSSLQILILDEADRCLDMGFEKTMNNIIEHLPVERQTLLFSATQTKSVKDLARLSLTNPRYISVDEKATYSTPAGLVQSYIQCELHDKINFLWSFIKNHRFHKSLIFLSCCKQVKYVYEVFCKLKPGVSLLSLYGSLHQTKRMAVYNSFCQKQHVVLFATDIAARGLDFPSVNWVVQLDCPESAIEYIHRAGRTARYERAGESLLALMPSEMKMLQRLENKKIPIQEIQVNMKNMQNIQRSVEALLARDTQLKESAQRAFVAYIKSVFLMKDKEVFDVRQLNTDAFARSLGLALSPRIRFLQKRQKQIEDEKNKQILENDDDQLVEKIKQADDHEDMVCHSDDKNTKKNELGKETKKWQIKDMQKNTFNFYEDNQNDDEDDDFLQIKRKNHELNIQPVVENANTNTSSKKSKKPCTRAALVKKMLKKNILPNKKIVFNEEGEVVRDKSKEYVSDLAIEYEKLDEAGIDIEKARMVLREEDKYDKQLFKERIKRKHREQKLKLKETLRDKSSEDEQSDNVYLKKGSSDESSNDDSGDDVSSENEPHASWYPNSDNRTSQDQESEHDLLDEDQHEMLPIKNRSHCAEKRKNSESNSIANVRKKQKKVVHHEDLNTLAAEEELALQLMNFHK